MNTHFQERSYVSRAYEGMSNNVSILQGEFEGLWMAMLSSSMLSVRQKQALLRGFHERLREVEDMLLTEYITQLGYPSNKSFSNYYYYHRYRFPTLSPSTCIPEKKSIFDGRVYTVSHYWPFLDIPQTELQYRRFLSSLPCTTL